jgi:ABC-type lipoprotein release transport system permease subunit
MRKTTEIILTLGGVLSAVAAFLLTVYLEDAKRFLDDLLSRLFGIPKSMVGINVVTAVIISLFVYAAFVIVFFSVTWILDRFGPKKRPVQDVPPMIQVFRLYV